MKSVLEYLSDRNVFSIHKNGNVTFTVTERCDFYYDVDLTKEQMLQLAEEIKALAES